jgi:hypothetical protein
LFFSAAVITSALIIQQGLCEKLLKLLMIVVAFFSAEQKIVNLTLVQKATMELNVKLFMP